MTTTRQAGLSGKDDPTQLEYATSAGAVLATFNIGHFVALHDLYETEGRIHGGIILLSAREPNHVLAARLARAARLLTPETARNALLYGAQFGTEELGQATAASLWV
ncbi:MAG: DUF5615 family PIN-like protein [Chloroflexota bacterium]